MGMFDWLVRKKKGDAESKSPDVKEVYTWLVTTKRIREQVYTDILISAQRMMAQKNDKFRKVLEQIGNRTIPNHVSIGTASSENFASSFIGWLKTKGITISDLNSHLEKSIFFLSGDADDPSTRISFKWAVFVYMR
jgi:hypothetical protein